MTTVKPLQGRTSVPADKSISHRAVMFSSVAEGTSEVRATLLGRDNLATIRIMRQLGVTISGQFNAQARALAAEEGLTDFSESPDGFCRLTIHGKGFGALRSPESVLDCGNSGTTSRLLCGLLAGCALDAELTGDESLIKRPFKRVTEPLSQMGAKFSGDMLPLKITRAEKALGGIEYRSPKASAQVKSAILLAGLKSSGEVRVIEPVQSRDHTERMLAAMGTEVTAGRTADNAWSVALPPPGARLPLKPLNLEVPGDFSSAAFLIVLASIVPGSDITITNVGYNPTRIGLLHILRRMGADIENLNQRVVGGEEVADLRVRSAKLRATTVDADDVVLAIDEIPILSVAAAFAEGQTLISGAEELRVKESDRLTKTAQVLTSFGVDVEELPDGLRIRGQTGVSQTPVDDLPWQGSGDHRIAMSAAVLRYALCGECVLTDQPAVETSFPGFLDCISGLI